MKSYTDIEQSKKLAEFLPLESADMCYLPTHIDDEHNFIASLSPYSICNKMVDVSIDDKEFNLSQSAIHSSSIYPS